jgi:sigma-E factor negative regulatory protein RseC
MKPGISKDKIEHKGVVCESDDQSVTVKIVSASACSACHAKNACGVAGTEEKILRIEGSFRFEKGEEVMVSMTRSDGFKALFYGYILPLFIILFILVLLSSLSLTELQAGFGSIIALGLYYLILRLFRNKIAREFTFSINA